MTLFVKQSKITFAQKNTEAYRSGHNGPDSKSGSPHGLVGSNPTASAIDKKVPIRVPFIIYTEQRTAVGFEGDRVLKVSVSALLIQNQSCGLILGRAHIKPIMKADVIKRHVTHLQIQHTPLPPLIKRYPVSGYLLSYIPRSEQRWDSKATLL